MHPVNLIYQAISKDDEKYPDIPKKTTEAICCVTGEKTCCVERKKVFGSNFTDVATFVAPASEFVSIAAFVALKYPYTRRSSWICDGVNFWRLNRQDVRTWVFGDKPKQQWCGYVTTSYKKHGVLKTVINSHNSNIWLFENEIVNCSNQHTVKDIWDRLNDALSLGISRPIIETLEINPKIIEKVGARNWLMFRNWAQDKYQSSLYRFMTYLLPSQKEIKELNKGKG